MKAVIPVAGVGTKLRPHTHTQPKPLIPVAGKPILGHIIDNLISAGIRKQVFIIGYLKEKIKDYVESEYKGKIENHAYQLFLSIAGIEHSTTKAYSPQTNGICERFNKTMKQEFFEIAMRKKIYLSLGELQQDLDTWLDYYNHERPHSGKFCYGKTPMQTFIDSKKLALEKNNEILYLEYRSDSQNLTDNHI